MKKAVFNPDEWAPSAPRKELEKPATPEAIEALTQAVEASGIDITPNYSDWLAIAFALVAELGEDGRSVYHRLSRFNPDYDPAETDRQYSACLRDGSRKITIASLFHIAQSHGVSWSRPHQHQFEDGEDLRMPKSIKSSVLTTPDEPETSNSIKVGTFSQAIKPHLPDLLKRIVADSVSDVDADLLILGSLTVFSARHQQNNPYIKPPFHATKLLKIHQIQSKTTKYLQSENKTRQILCTFAS